MSKPQLNAEQQQIIVNKQVRLKKPIGELIDLLKPVALFDTAAGQSRSRMGCLAAIAIVIGLILFFVDTIPMHLIFGFVFVGGGIALGVIASRMQKDDLSDNLARCAVPLLVALREDFGGEPVEVTLDLRLPLSKEKQTSKEKVDKVTTTIYTDAWFSGDGMLADGSRLRWNVVDVIHEKSYWKRGSSGKNKLKTKRKKRVEIDVDLTLRARTYATEGDEKKQTLHAEAKLKRDTVDPIPPDEIINVIAGLYAQVRPAS